jgi:hypothetical protein
MYRHLAAARYTTPRLDAPLYVIGVVFNPLRYQTRQNLYREFVKHASDAGAIVYIVELSLGTRPHAIASEKGLPRYDGRDDHIEEFQKWQEVQTPPGKFPHTLIQLQTDQELWHKEAMINAAAARLPQDWKYVAWVDADVTFVNPDWVHETLQQLQHYPIVQMFTHAFDVGPNGAPSDQFKSFAYSWLTNPSGLPNKSASKGTANEELYYGIGGDFHPGFAWAFRREAWNTLGGMLDINIVGGGDYQMAFGLVGEIDRAYPFDAHRNYVEDLHNWQTNALRLKKNIGAVPGTIAHHWHGQKVQRGYFDRWKILQRTNYDPRADLRRDWQMLYQLSGDKPQLRDELRTYFRARNEDGTEEATS